MDILVRGAAFLYKRSKRRKRGKRAGALVKFRQRGFRTPLPSIHLANLRSLANKSDELQLLTHTNKDFLNSAALCFTETWLNGTIPDSALHLTGFQPIRADRVTERKREATNQGPMQGSCLWTSALLSTPSFQISFRINCHSSLQQLVRLGKLTSGIRTISTGAPQGCVLSPLLFSLYTNDCTSKDSSVKLLKFADDTTVIDLIRDGDESAYRQEVKQLSLWCSHNNLELNTLKTVEMTVDFRRKPPALPPLTVMNSTVAAVDSFKFLGTNISQDLKWDIHIDSIFNLPQALMTQFYSAVFESVLKSDIRRLQRTVKTAERINGVHLPNLQDLYISRVKKRAGNIIQDPSQPGHNLFALLPSGKHTDP
ncbi:hypothetical protein M9458_056996 [Cirrhinus mrigala]|uniref:Reverse transcriptase domain-containing protein n=1 Tax=Cirrhinus mrigala TaxID=683832 RepID=A0ABD0MG07_CIRMR